MKEVFISWSGKKANIYAEFLKNMLDNIFNKDESIFYSGEMDSGVVWLERINVNVKFYAQPKMLASLSCDACYSSQLADFPTTA